MSQPGVRFNRLDSEYKEVKLHVYFNEKFNTLKQCYKYGCMYNLTCFNIKNLHLIPGVCMCFLKSPSRSVDYFRILHWLSLVMAHCGACDVGTEFFNTRLFQKK
jgi:hypothetical protein